MNSTGLVKVLTSSRFFISLQLQEKPGTESMLNDSLTNE